MSGTTLVVSHWAQGHFNCVLAVMAGLAERGRKMHLITDARHRHVADRLGIGFTDLNELYPVDAVDPTSLPYATRLVTHAAEYAPAMTAEAESLGVDLIVYDTFMVIAPLVARRLSVPYVNVFANHAAEPQRTMAALRTDGRASHSDALLAAVETLRSVHGITDATPFHHVAMLSPHLNVYPEPAEFLDDEARAAFDPLAYFGLIAPELRQSASGVFPDTGRRRMVAAFGAIIWRYYEAEALAALQATAAACADLEIDLVIGLGGNDIPADAWAELEAAGALVAEDLDQWSALGEADLMLTHNGINSTHECIWHGVPMISYPFIADQPAQARRCQELGLATPLTGEPRGAVTAADVIAAIERIEADADGFAARLARARGWDERTIAGRPAVLDRILALAG